MKYGLNEVILSINNLHISVYIGIRKIGPTFVEKNTYTIKP